MLDFCTSTALHSFALIRQAAVVVVVIFLGACSRQISPIATIKVAVTKPAMAICPSPDGKMIVAIFQREPALLIDVEKSHVIKSFEKVYRCAAWDAEAGCILLGGDSGVDVVSESDWHVKSSTLEAGQVFALAVGRNGIVLTGSYAFSGLLPPGELGFYIVHDFQLKKIGDSVAGNVLKIALGADGVVATHDGGRLRIGRIARVEETGLVRCDDVRVIDRNQLVGIAMNECCSRLAVLTSTDVSVYGDSSLETVLGRKSFLAKSPQVALASLQYVRIAMSDSGDYYAYLYRGCHLVSSRNNREAWTHSGIFGSVAFLGDSSVALSRDGAIDIYEVK